MNRNLLELLNNSITALVAMSADAAKLDELDNDLASRRLKKAITDFKKNELKVLQDKVFDVRQEIKDLPRKRRVNNLIKIMPSIN